jgi:hypothetical protein
MATAKRTTAKRTTAKRSTVKPNRAPKKSPSMREAAITVFHANENRPLAAKDLYAAILKVPGYKVGKGKTPVATLAAQLYTKPDSFEKVGKGEFRANPAALKKAGQTA